MLVQVLLLQKAYYITILKKKSMLTKKMALGLN